MFELMMLSFSILVGPLHLVKMAWSFHFNRRVNPEVGYADLLFYVFSFPTQLYLEEIDHNYEHMRWERSTLLAIHRIITVYLVVAIVYVTWRLVF